MRRLRELEEKTRAKCEEIAKKYFPKDKYKVTGVYPMITAEGKPVCIINFRRLTYEAPVDCYELCERLVPWGEEEKYDECVSECEDNLKLITTNSVEVDPETLEVKSSSVAGSCHPIMPEPEEEEEEFEKRREEFYKSFEKIGCELKEGWIHPHELARGTVGVEIEEEPVTCFYHIKSKNGGCKLPDVLRLVEEKF